MNSNFADKKIESKDPVALDDLLIGLSFSGGCARAAAFLLA
jgi:hypothetical protein